MKIQIQHRPPSVLHGDLERKFNVDLKNLIARSIDLITPELGQAYTTSLILSTLGVAGFHVARAAGLAPGTFAAMAAETEKFLTEKKGEKK